MPRPIAEVDGDLQDVKGKVIDIDRVTAQHGVRLNAAEQLGDELYQDHRATAQKVDDLRRESECEIALMKHQVEELKKDRDKWEQRFWLFVIPLSVMVLGALILAAIGLKKP